MGRAGPPGRDGRRGHALLRLQPPQGKIENPGYDKLAALAEAMGFPPAEWFAKDPLDEKTPAGLNGKQIEALLDPTVLDVVRELSRLPERDKRLVLGIVRQLEDAGDRRTRG